MTVCPIAIVSGCKKCPAFSLCPLKGVLGDYKAPDEKESKQESGKGQGSANPKQ